MYHNCDRNGTRILLLCMCILQRQVVEQWYKHEIIKMSIIQIVNRRSGGSE